MGDNFLPVLHLTHQIDYQCAVILEHIWKTEAPTQLSALVLVRKRMAP